MSSASLFERIGGEAAVNAAVDVFYCKVIRDKRVSRFFEGIDIERQTTQQKAFLTLAFGGPYLYNGRDMRTAHERLVKDGMDDTHFDVVMEHLVATLTELKIPAELIAEVATIAESTRNDVLCR